MKHVTLFLFSMCISLMLHAQVSNSVIVIPGGLSTALKPPELCTVTNLKLTGSMGAKDAAGNVSEKSDTVIITSPDLSPVYSDYFFEECSGTTVINSKGPNNGTVINKADRVNLNYSLITIFHNSKKI